MTFSATVQTPTICNRVADNSLKFQSWARSMMLGQSRTGSLMPMTISPTLKPRSHAKRPCPDCGAALVRRSSNSEHLLLSKTFLICKNPVCGATFAGIDEITHRLSPPSQPNKEIHLPYAPSSIRRGVLAVLGLSTECEEPFRSEPTVGEENRP